MRELGLSIRKRSTTEGWVHLVIDLHYPELQLLNSYGCVVKIVILLLLLVACLSSFASGALQHAQ